MSCAVLAMMTAAWLSASGLAGQLSQLNDGSCTAEQNKPHSGQSADPSTTPRQPADKAEQTPAKPKWPVSRETTYFTEPLDKDGYVDYLAAWNAYFGKDVVPQNNAYALLIQAIGPRPAEKVRLPDDFFRSLNIAPLPDEGEYFVPFNRFVHQRIRPKSEEEWQEKFDQLRQATQHPWKEDDLPLVADWLRVNQKPLELITQAAQRPQWYRPLLLRSSKSRRAILTALDLSDLQLMREVNQALRARCMLRCARAQRKLAWRDLLSAGRLSRLVQREPTTLGSLIGLAMENAACRTVPVYLEASQPDPETLRSLLREWQRLPPRPSLADKLDVGERIVCLDSFQYWHRHGSPPGEDSGWQLPLVQGLMPWKKMLTTVNVWYDRLSAAAREPDHARRQKAYDALESELQKLLAGTEQLKLRDMLVLLTLRPGDKLGERIVYMLLNLSLPAIRDAQQSFDRSEQYARLAELAIALEMYRAETGSYPQRLEDLSPKYLPTLPMDIFSGRPPIYRRTERGYVLYSVGPNGRDDAGRTADDQPPGDDLRFEIPVPMPKQRSPRDQNAKPDQPDV